MPPGTLWFRVHVFDLDACGRPAPAWCCAFCSGCRIAGGGWFDDRGYERQERSGSRRTIIDYLAACVPRCPEVRTWVSTCAACARSAVRSVAPGVQRWRRAPRRLRTSIPPRRAVRRRGHALSHGRRRPPRRPRCRFSPIARRELSRAPSSLRSPSSLTPATPTTRGVGKPSTTRWLRTVARRPGATPAGRRWRATTEYFAEAAYADTLLATVWTGDATADGFATECTLSRDGTRVLHASTRWRHAPDGAPASLGAAVAALSG